MMYDICSDAPFYQTYTAVGGFCPFLLVIAAVTYQPLHLVD